MNKKFLITLSLILSTSVFSLSNSNESAASETNLLVYKSSTCRCCNAWIVHMKNNGFDNITTKDVTNLGDIKNNIKLKMSIDLATLQYHLMDIFLKVTSQVNI